MKSELWNDAKIIEAIENGGYSRQKAIAQIYRMNQVKERVRYFVLGNKGNAQDAEDLFHEGIIVLDRNIRNSKFRGESSLHVYLFSICRFLWMNQLRKSTKITYTDNPYPKDRAVHINPEDVMINKEKSNMLIKAMNDLGKKCQKVLQLWQLSYSMQEIAREMKLSSEMMARKTKYQCLKKLINAIENNPQIQNLVKPE